MMIDGDDDHDNDDNNNNNNNNDDDDVPYLIFVLTFLIIMTIK